VIARTASDELALAEPDESSEPGLQRGDGVVEVGPGHQRAALDPEALEGDAAARAKLRVPPGPPGQTPEVGRRRRRDEDLVAELAGVADPGDGDRDASE